MSNTSGEINLEEILLRIARDQYHLGPCMGQESLVLQAASDELNAQGDVRLQQKILTVWHQLFQLGRLVWGYDLINPGHPFYHFPEWVEHEQPEQAMEVVTGTHA